MDWKILMKLKRTISTILLVPCGCNSIVLSSSKQLSAHSSNDNIKFLFETICYPFSAFFFCVLPATTDTISLLRIPVDKNREGGEIVVIQIMFQDNFNLLSFIKKYNLQKFHIFLNDYDHLILLTLSNFLKFSCSTKLFSEPSQLPQKINLIRTQFYMQFLNSSYLFLSTTNSKLASGQQSNSQM